MSSWKYTYSVQKQFWLEYLVSWCSVFVTLAPGGMMDIKIQYTCLWLTLLSVALSLQAYAVQGQHAIPQPDVSEGPSVSDPIYLKLRSWGAMPPPYFIPLTLIYPATTAC